MSAEPTFGQMVRAVADGLGRPLAELTPDAPIVGAVCLDSLDLYQLYVVLDHWLPGFELPEQLDLGRATLGDAHHYLVTRLGQARLSPREPGSGAVSSAPSDR